jgi:TolB protein
MKKIFFLIIPVYLFSQGEVYLKLKGGEAKKIDIGIFPLGLFEKISPNLKLSLKEIQKVLVDDLKFSLYFTLTVPDSQILEKKHYSDFLFWKNLGSNILLRTKTFEKEKNIEVELVDLLIQKRIAKEKFSLLENERKVAHKIANFVVKILTGEEGIFETYIVFTVDINDKREIYMMDYDGFNLRKINAEGEKKLFPRISYCGKKIIYSTYIKKDMMGIYLIDLNDNKIEKIIEEKGLALPGGFFPNSKEVCLTLSKEGDPEIYLFNIENKKLKRLTYSPFIEISPTVSPSGKEIAFVSDRLGSPHIFIMDKDGANLRRITYETSYNTSCNWSPRGDFIAYVALDDEGKNQIYLTDPFGEKVFKLTYEGNNEDPCFSPDGLHIVFVSTREGGYDVYVMDFDGSNLKKLTNIGTCHSPYWSGIK